ncbi:hypothetical protein BS78_10G142100 [Paspalum vaginatum]|nr:hypothetical protein BS78_10G142100 [Paspalum vaginatum]
MVTPSIDHVLRRFGPLPVHSHLEDAGSVAAQRAAAEATVGEDRGARGRGEGAHEGRQGEGAAGSGGGREADVDALGEAELPEFALVLERLRDSVQLQANKMQTSARAVARRSCPSSPWRSSDSGTACNCKPTKCRPLLGRWRRRPPVMHGVYCDYIGQ